MRRTRKITKRLQWHHIGYSITTEDPEQFPKSFWFEYGCGWLFQSKGKSFVWQHAEEITNVTYIWWQCTEEIRFASEIDVYEKCWGNFFFIWDRFYSYLWLFIAFEWHFFEFYDIFFVILWQKLLDFVTFFLKLIEMILFSNFRAMGAIANSTSEATYRIGGVTHGFNSIISRI